MKNSFLIHKLIKSDLFLKISHLFLLGFIIVSCNLTGDNIPSEKIPIGTSSVTLLGISINNPTPNLPSGRNGQLTAIATYSNGTTIDITGLSASTWSSNIADVTVGNHTGLATAINAAIVGAIANISISYLPTGSSTPVTTSTTITVTAPEVVSLNITRPLANLPQGQSELLTATATFSNGSTVDVTTASGINWSSSASTNISVGATTGVALTANNAAIGTANNVTITATYTHTSGTVNATTSITPTAAVITGLAVTPATSNLPQGQSLSLVATATFSNGSTAVVTTASGINWSSSASVNIAIGATTGVATTANASPIGSANNATITATYTHVSGTVSGTAVITPVAAAVTSLAVTPATSNLPQGQSLSLVATVTFSNGSTAIVTTASGINWSSSANANVAVGATTGVATTANASPIGSANNVTITATYTHVSGTVSGTATITPTAAVITGLAVTPATSNLPRGRSLPLTATATFSNGSTANVTTASGINWTTSNGSNVTVGTNTGIAATTNNSLIGAGNNVTITATYTHVSGTVNGTATITPVAAIAISLSIVTPNVNLPRGASENLQAFALFSDGITLNVTTATEINWSSASPSEISVGATTGVATTSNTATVGNNTIITATFTPTVAQTPTSVAATTTLTVGSAAFTGLTVTPAQSSVPNGSTANLQAIANFSDSSTFNVTSQANWVSNNANVSVGATTGIVTANTVGSSTITATYNATPATGTVLVTNTPTGVNLINSQTPGVLPANQNNSSSLVTTLTQILPFNTLIAAGSNHTCAVSQSSNLSCWGDGTFGQLGNAADGYGANIKENPDTRSGFTNTPVTQPASNIPKTPPTQTGFSTPVRALYSSAACAANPGNFGVCQATLNFTNALSSPGDDLPRIAHVSTGNAHTCVNYSSFSYFQFVSFSNASSPTNSNIGSCWGLASNGRLGNFDSSPSIYPFVSTSTNRTAPTSTDTLRRVSTPTYEAPSNTNLIGYNNPSQNGYSPSSGNPVDSIFHFATGIRSGFDFSCGLFNNYYASDRVPSYVACWGRNTEGQLGINSTTASPFMQNSVSTSGTGILTQVFTLSAGYSFACTVMTNGSVLCWGDNSHAQLGRPGTYPLAGCTGGGELGTEPTNCFSTIPLAIPTLGANNPSINIATGQFHACVILRDSGRIQCWGANDSGQLGNGTSGSPSSTPVFVQDTSGNILTNAVDITAGEAHTCALFKNGTIRCWGRNNSGQLGDGQTINVSNISTSAIDVVSISATSSLFPTRVVTGQNHTCTLMNDWTARCWGANALGQLGNGNTTNSSTPVTVALP